MLRSMDKITDRRDPATGSADQLPLDKCRARLEVTLQGDIDKMGAHGAVGLETVGDLDGFRFESLRSPVFAFFLPTLEAACSAPHLPFSVRVREQDAFARSGVYGLDRLHRSIEAVQRAAHKGGEIDRGPTPLARKGHLVAYTDLNRRFDKALRGLSQRWSGHAVPAAP